MIGNTQQKRLAFFFLSVLAMLSGDVFGFTWLSRSDPVHVFTTLDPQTFLNTRAKCRLKGEPVEYTYNEFMSLSISPFGQNADIGRDMSKNDVQLGDLEGTRNFVPLMYGALPEGVYTFPPSIAEARGILFPGVPQTTPIPDEDGIALIDPSQKIGFVSFPLKYRKRGVRGEFSFQVTHGFGILLQLGVSDICQVPSPVITCSTSDSCCWKGTEEQIAEINKYLTCKYKEIGKELCINFDTFHDGTFEDVAIQGYWRYAYEVNAHRKEDDWAHFLAIPFFTVGGVVAAGKEKPLYKAFGLSFGNDGFNAVGFDLGINLDFVETVEIGAEGGITHFFERGVCQMPVPTSCLQSGIYPFRTDVCVEPGDNWNFSAKMNAYHFLDHLSCFIQYVYVSHQKDCIKLKQPDAAFKPECLEKISCWSVQVANVGLNYDISPSISLGFLWQAPLKQVNAYRSSLIMCSLSAFF